MEIHAEAQSHDGCLQENPREGPAPSGIRMSEAQPEHNAGGEGDGRRNEPAGANEECNDE